MGIAVVDEVSREKFFSMLEKAVRPQFFLLIVSFLLFVDSALVRFSGFGLRDIETSTSIFTVSLVLKLTLIFVAFSGLASLVLPFLMVPMLVTYIDVKYMIWLFFYRVKKHLFGAEDSPMRSKRRPHNRVSPRELLDAAHEGENAFLMDIYKEDRFARRQCEAERREVQRYAFCALVFLIVNYLVLGENSAHAISHWIVEYWVSNAPIWIAIGLLGWLVVFPVHQDDSENEWIYCPPQYRKLEVEEGKRRKEERELERKMRLERETE